MSDHATSMVRELAHQPVVGTAKGLHLPGGHSDPLAGAEITAIHAAGGELWVLAGRRHLHRLHDGHAELVAELDVPAGICVASHAGTVWVGGDEAGLWRLDGTALEPVASFLEAPTRDEWHTPWGGPPAVFSMASHGDDLYVGVHVGGILRSSDGGRSWVPTIDLHDDVHQVAVDEAGAVWAATGRGGLARSTDRGATWEYHTAGLHARYLLAVAPTSDGVLVGASSGHAAKDGALYRLDGDNFERCRGGLPDDFGGAVSPRHLAAGGQDAAVALPAGDVYTSSDGGRTWARVAEGLSGISEVTYPPGT